ncbi:MAG: PAS domain-containing protein, partial [Bacteroidetes bacterium]|nr:PAS domain-containing protein [Bacteroidota bacterium]
EMILSGKMIKVPGGFHVLSFGSYSEEISAKVDQLLDLGDIYTVPFVVDQNIYGNFCLLTRSEQPKPDSEFFETIAWFSSLALHRQKILKELQENRRRYVMATKAGRVGVFDVDLATHQVFLDPLVKELLGWTPDEGTVDILDWLKYLHPDDRQGFLDKVMACVSGEKDEFVSEHRSFNNDGSIVWIYSQGRVFCDKLGNPVWVVGTAIDISEIKKAQEDLVVALSRAEESDRLKTSFLANLSHEIRTPLNSILGFSQLLKEKDLPEHKQNQFLDVINSSGNLLLELMNDIIDIARIEAGTITVSPDRIHVGAFFQNLKTISGSMQKRLKRENLSVVVKLPKSFNPEKYTDEIRLHQIMLHLISNALKFTDEGTVTFGFRETTKNAIFFVKDTGCGIAQENHEVIFERFRQLDSSISRNHSGSGLGLAVVRGLAEAVGAAVVLESIPGKGSTFSIVFDQDKFNVSHN